MGIINEIKDGVQKNKVALDYLKNIVKVDGSPDDPKCFMIYRNLLNASEMLEKMDRLEKGQDSLHRHMQEGLDSPTDVLKR